MRDNWMNKAQQSGAYRIRVVRATPKPYVLRLTLLDPHDPRLDVGIRPEQSSILDVHKEITWHEERFFPASPNLGEFGPANIDGEGGRLTFHARKQFLKGPSVRALRWLCSYDQMDLPFVIRLATVPTAVSTIRFCPIMC